MSYNLAYSVLTPITNGETGLQVRAIRDSAEISLRDGDVASSTRRSASRKFGVPITNLFGMKMSGYPGFYFCAVLLIICFFIAMCITKSNFGMMLKAIKSNQNRLNYTGIHTRPYLISAFVISGMYAGLAGSLLAITDPIAGAERMQWTASGEVVLMTILGGAGTLDRPGAGRRPDQVRRTESLILERRHPAQCAFSFLPDGVEDFFVGLFSFFRRRGLAPDARPSVHGDRHLPAGRPDGRRAPYRAGQRQGDRSTKQHVGQAYGRTGVKCLLLNHYRTTRKTRGFRSGVPDKVLHIDDVHKSFAGLHALSDVDLDVRKGETHAIIGPNGAGKSTLLNVCVGRLKPDRGAVIFDGDTLTGKAPHEINQLGVARVFQTPEVFLDLTVLENVMVPALSKPRRSFQAQSLSGVRQREGDPRGSHRRHPQRRPARPAERHGNQHVARRQAAAGTGHVPDPASEAAVAGRADRRHGPRRHQCHHRSSEEDQGRRHDQGDHRARHACRVLAGRPDQRAGRRAHHRPGHARGDQEQSEASRKPISGRNRYDGSRRKHDAVSRKAEDPQGAVFRDPQPQGLLRRQLHRPGYLLRHQRGRDPGAARPQRRRQDLDPAHDRAGRLADLRSGEIWLKGEPVHEMQSFQAALHGIQLVPEDRRIIQGMTVEENLDLACISGETGWDYERIYALFPRLKERRKQEGTTLSGGEQQMLAIARALARDLKLLLLDEPYEGLAPVVRARHRKSAHRSAQCRHHHHHRRAERRRRAQARRPASSSTPARSL
jgi:ABC-type branched-subunit amino acid transport system ATPase component